MKNEKWKNNIGRHEQRVQRQKDWWRGDNLPNAKIGMPTPPIFMYTLLQLAKAIKFVDQVEKSLAKFVLMATGPPVGTKKSTRWNQTEWPRNTKITRKNKIVVKKNTLSMKARWVPIHTTTPPTVLAVSTYLNDRRQFSCLETLGPRIPNLSVDHGTPRRQKLALVWPIL